MIRSVPDPIRVMIVDDEPLARRGLEQLLAAHADCRIVATCRSGREMVRTLSAARPDVVFLDIQMPGLDGFEVLRTLDTGLAPSIVFVTAYDEFAIRAFEERALDYLLKPVSQERFDRALQRVREQRRAEQAVRLARQLARFYGDTLEAERGRQEGGGAVSQCVVAPTAAGEVVLTAEEIDWIQAMDYCSAVHAGGRRYIIRESLGSLERRLDPAAFVRLHRSAIVRLDRVRELRAADSGGVVLVLRNGTRLPVSRRRHARVAELIRRL